MSETTTTTKESTTMSTTTTPTLFDSVAETFGVHPDTVHGDARHLAQVIGVEPTGHDMAAFFAGVADGKGEASDGRMSEPGLMVAAAVAAGMTHEAAYWEGVSVGHRRA